MKSESICVKPEIPNRFDSDDDYWPEDTHFADNFDIEEVISVKLPADNIIFNDGLLLN